MNLLEQMKTELERLAAEKGWLNETMQVACNALSAEEAIGTPAEQDYPIQKGKETMLQVSFGDFHGQAFSREVFRNRTATLQEVLALPLDSDGNRAILIAAANAMFCAAGRIDRTIHCKNQEPAECAKHLGEITSAEKVALFGLQPRFLEKLNELGEVRCVDIDPDLIGTLVGGVLVEPPENTTEIIEWADRLLVTGSATVNDTFSRFLDPGKPLHVFGTTGAGAAHVLGLQRYCRMAKPS
jgi:uncharacterized protein (DUF4213/DUF364 family)